MDSYYISFVTNLNTHAYSHMRNVFNLYGTPTTYFDGGYDLVVGAGSVSGAKAAYEASINLCGNRPVADLDATLTVDWLTGAAMHIELTIDNLDASAYDGYVRVFIVEHEATQSGWKDGFGDPYTMAFLDFAINEPIAIGASGTWQQILDWDGALHNDGYGHTFDYIWPDNIMVIAAVYEGTPHLKYSYPPNINPFDAFYLDEMVAVTPIGYYADLEIDTFTAPSQVDPGDNVYGQVDLVLGNDGDNESGDFYTGLYISTDDTITTGDTPLIDGRVYVPNVAMGGTYTVTFPSTLAIPTGLDMGFYYIGVVVDEDEEVHEKDETNNTIAQLIKIGDPPVPDIKINGDDGPITLPSWYSINMTISLQPASLNGVIQDWWIVAYKGGGGVYSWVYSLPWHWTSGLQKAHRGPLFALNNYSIRNGTIPAGTWTIEFAVDEPNYFYEKTYMDFIEVTSN